MNFGDRRLPPRFWDKVSPCPMSGCWLWTARLNEAGYGEFNLAWRKPGTRLAHRIAYQTLAGAVPAGLELDHRCRTPSCTNPAHLEAVTHRENCLRGVSPSAAWARATHCQRGHALSGANLIVRRNGVRVCRQCSRARDRGRAPERVARMRAEGVCSSCSAKAAPGRTKCERHLQANREAEAARRARRL